MTNEEIAAVFDRIAELLDAHHANPFRIGSYRRAARELRAMRRSVAQIHADEGEAALVDLPAIGVRLASAIGELVETGRLGMLDRMEAEEDPVAVLMRVPGLGETLANRIWQELGVDSLEELEAAAHDGRLARLKGFGPRKLEGLRATLATLLRRRTNFDRDDHVHPPIEVLLDIDEQYRREADRGALPTIAPRRFNPRHEPWLPILKTRAAGWYFSALFSNTARAHELGKTHDWVVIYYDHDDVHDQCTVVTERSGDLAGRRVVRGRERECRRHYERQI